MSRILPVRTLSLSLWLLLFTTALSAGDGVIRRNKNPIPNQYIVQLRPDLLPTLPSLAEQLALQHGGRIRILYDRAVIGFSIEMTEAQAQRLATHPAVLEVEENASMELSATATDSVPNDWAVDRIDQVSWSLSGTYTYCTTRSPQLSDAQPVLVYVFDGGVDRNHPQFRYLDGSAHAGYDGTNDQFRVHHTGYDFAGDGLGRAVDPWSWPYSASCGPDRRGFNHGTWVASLIAGRTIGVDKQAFIVPVRVVPCNVSSLPEDRVIQAINHVMALAPAGRTHVANFSLFKEGAGTALDNAINSLIDRNFVVVTSANNQNQDKCAVQSPARVPRAITVGGTTNSPMDQRVRDFNHPNDPGSNFGNCIDIFAPGHNVRAAASNPDGLDIMSAPAANQAATSLSAALVSGAAARYLQQYPTATPGQVWNYLSQQSASLVSDHRSPNACKPFQYTYARLLNVVPECP